MSSKENEEEETVKRKTKVKGSFYYVLGKQHNRLTQKTLAVNSNKKKKKCVKCNKSLCLREEQNNCYRTRFIH